MVAIPVVVMFVTRFEPSEEVTLMLNLMMLVVGMATFAVTVIGTMGVTVTGTAAAWPTAL